MRANSNPHGGDARAVNLSLLLVTEHILLERNYLAPLVKLCIAFHSPCSSPSVLPKIQGAFFCHLGRLLASSLPYPAFSSFLSFLAFLAFLARFSEESVDLEFEEAFLRLPDETAGAVIL